MLDDLKLIHERDAQDALGIAGKQGQQLLLTYDISKIEGQFTNVIIGGMGGSALAASLTASWPGVPVPYEICRNYDIPGYVSSQTLFIASSYSGNTEETVSALQAAEEKGATIAVITSGGQLEQIAAEKGYPLAKLPAGFQPRMAVFANWKALLEILDAAGITNNAAAELASKSALADDIGSSYKVDIATASNYPKQLALDIVGKSAVVYAGPQLAPAAYKWKISFNENAKNVAWWNQLPEFNHNEFLGWTSHPIDKPYVVIDLRSTLDHPQVQKRFVVTEKLLSGRRPAPIVVTADQQTILEQLIWLVILGDFVSIYLAILNGLNPTPVDLIEKFKSELGR